MGADPAPDAALDPGTEARSALYLALAGALAFPDPALAPAVADGSLHSLLGRRARALPYPLPPPPAALAEPTVGAAELESEYIRLFDVGPGGPPCPLYGGVYQGDRMQTMEEVTRFYHFFGLRLAPGPAELPDHATTELEFMHYLTFREGEERRRGGDPAPLVRAERDFLARHLCRWVPRLAERLERQEPHPFFAALVGWWHAFLDADRAWLEARVE